MMNFYEPIENPEDEIIASLSTLEVKPPMSVWRNISSELDSRRHKKMVKGVTLAAAAAVSAIVGIGSMLLAGSDLRVDSKPLEMASLSSNEFTLPKHSTGVVPPQKSPVVFGAPIPAEAEPALAILDSPSEAPIEPQLQSITPLATSIPVQGVDPESLPSLAVREVKLPPLNEKKVGATAKSPWSLSFSGAPVYAFHSEGVLNQFHNKTESGIWSWGFDLLVGYETRRGFSFHTGIAITPIGQIVGDVFLVEPNITSVKFNNYRGASTSLGYVTLGNSRQRLFDYPDMAKVSTETIKKSSVNLVSLQQKLSYLEIPVLISKSFQGKYGYFFVRTGMSVGLLVGNKAEVYGANSNLKGRTVGINGYSYSWIGSFGVAVPVYGKVNLMLEPSFKLWLIPVDAPLGVSYPFSTTVKAGILIPF